MLGQSMNFSRCEGQIGLPEHLVPFSGSARVLIAEAPNAWPSVVSHEGKSRSFEPIILLDNWMEFDICANQS